MFGRVVKAVVPGWISEVVAQHKPAATDVVSLARRSVGRARWAAAEARAVAHEVRLVVQRRYGFAVTEPEAPEPSVVVEEVKREPSLVEVAGWITAIRFANTSHDPARVRSACEATLRLADLSHFSAEVLRALEETITVRGFPFRLQMAAVDALGWSGSVASDRALRRMRAVVRRRLGWERVPEDELLLRRIEGQLAAAPRQLVADFAPAA